jgi:hypothetical protein
MSVHGSAEFTVSQILLRLQYQDLARRGVALPDFADVEFSNTSQNGEDGILHYIFSLIGVTNRAAVEICAGDGLQCNAANLIINQGWQGLLIDGDEVQLSAGRSFYSTCPTTWLSPPTLLGAWVTAENVNALVTGHGYSGSIDLLSLDLDGNDYWVWKALDCVTPRVVVLEFNAACGPERSMSIAYQPDFRLDFSVQPYRCGASLPAFAKLARSKGYRLVGVESNGVNAFFVRDGVGELLVPERSVQALFAQTERLKRWHASSLDLMLSGEQPWVDV